MGILPETFKKIKPFYFPLLILVILSILWGGYRLSALQNTHTPIRIGYGDILMHNPENSSQTASVLTATLGSSGEVIGSKTGKKYYFPWCGTVKRIKPENQVHFSSVDEAKTAGFTPGGNCKGLK